MNMTAYLVKGQSLSRCVGIVTLNFSGGKIRTFSCTAISSLGLVVGKQAARNTGSSLFNNSFKSVNRARCYSTIYKTCRATSISPGVKFVYGRNQSTSADTLASTQIPTVFDDLPEPPVPPSSLLPEPPVSPGSLLSDVPIADSGLLEPTLASQGLASWYPPGILQSALEYLHINLDMPWWLAIATGTFIVRFFLFPLVIASQRNAANMNNNMPQMQVLQLKMSQARASGNVLEATHLAEELMIYMKEKKLSPFKSMLIPMAQAPIFVSFFFGLRAMANLPVESFKQGGLWWFTNLTVPDPFYVLPLITSATLFLTIELGVEGGIRSGNLQTMKYVLRALPIVIFPFIMNFPSAVLCYWVTSNALSLIQVSILRLKPVRAYLKIPKIVRIDPSQLPAKKGFTQGIKESFRNARVIGELEDRARVDEMRFRKAGTGPIQKTYSYDPTKQMSAAGSSKGKDKKL